MLSIKEYRDKYYPRLTKVLVKKHYRIYQKELEATEMDCCTDTAPRQSINDIYDFKDSPCKAPSISTLQDAVPTKGIKYSDPWCVKQEGKNPMRYNENNAIATITSAKSDIATTREYFLSRLDSTMYPKTEALVEMFNLHVDNQPKNFSDLIAVIKAGTYTIDPKVQKKFDALDAPTDWYHGSTYGIIWPGPKKDIEGWRAAETEMYKQQNIARDLIMSGDGAAALAALQAFEAWMPTAATPAS